MKGNFIKSFIIYLFNTKLFLTRKKEYIYTEKVVSSAQGVPRKPLKYTNSQP